MIPIKTSEEIEIQRKSSLLVGKTLAEVAKLIRPGVTTRELDQVADTFISDHGAVPGFKGYGGFPAALCISVNDEVVHGIPGDRILKNGDIVSIDCGTLMNGFYGDSAYTFAVGDVKEEVLMLMKRKRRELLSWHLIWPKERGDNSPWKRAVSGKKVSQNQKTHVTGA